jgi:predicted hotdog family 3-hydroxylacyl-ACP dehydratase
MSYRPIADYLPHRSPMIMLDKIISIQNDFISCSVMVSSDGTLAPFLNEQNELPAYYFIELMAQTIGIWNGFHAQSTQEKPKIAFLLSSRLFETQIPTAPLNTDIIIEAKLILKDEQLANFEAAIIIDHQNVAQARLNVYQPDQTETEQLLQESSKQ